VAKTVQDLPPGPVNPVAAGTGGPSKVPGDRKWAFKRITGDANYQAGGYVVLPGDVGLTQIDYCLLINDGGAGEGGPANLTWFWDTDSQALLLIVTSTGAEFANGQDAHLAFMDCAFIGY
jgi:hypothetical protein